MPLVTSKEMFKKAYDGGYAIGAFNVNNMEIVQGITEAARDVNAPLILQVSKGARAYANHTYLSLIHILSSPLPYGEKKAEGADPPSAFARFSGRCPPHSQQPLPYYRKGRFQVCFSPLSEP